MNRIKTFITAGLGAAVALVASRFPIPDASTLDRAGKALSHDAQAGLRALGWEATRLRTVAGIDTGLENVATWAALSPTASLIIVICAAGVGIGLAAVLRRDPQTPEPRRSTRTPDRRVIQARDMARKGVFALDVARQTALPRDAVTLLARVSGPDGVAGRGRSFRRMGAR